MTPTTNERTDTDRPPGSQYETADGVTGAAREEAGQLKETSVDAAQEVAGTVKEKASDVTSDVRQQAQRLAGQTRDQLFDQASRQKERATQGLRSVSDELRGMAEQGQSGVGAQLAQHGARFADQTAAFLQQHEPGELLEEVRGFARRKPGTFLLVAAVAGVAAGRLTRALAAGQTPSGTADRRGTAGESVALPVDDAYLVPPPASSAEPASVRPPMATPVAPDPDPGAPVTPKFGPGTGQ
jgi:hypothetical protein